MKEERTNKRFNNGKSDPADEAFFSPNSQPNANRQRPQNYIEKANVATEDSENQEGVGEFHLMQKEEDWNVTTVTKKAIQLQPVALEFEMKKSHMLMWQNPRKTKKIMILASIEKRNVNFSVRSNLDFFADSGATSHMSDQQQFFDTLEMIDTGNRTVSVVGGVSLPVRGRGDIKIETTVNGTTRTGLKKGVLYVPNLGTNLFSIGTATENGTEIHFNNNQVHFSREGVIFMVGQRAGRGLYHLIIRVVPKQKRQ
jgi:hypothetical protein